MKSMLRINWNERKHLLQGTIEVEVLTFWQEVICNRMDNRIISNKSLRANNTTPALHIRSLATILEKIIATPEAFIFLFLNYNY